MCDLILIILHILDLQPELPDNNPIKAIGNNIGFMADGHIARQAAKTFLTYAEEATGHSFADFASTMTKALVHFVSYAETVSMRARYSDDSRRRTRMSSAKHKKDIEIDKRLEAYMPPDV